MITVHYICIYVFTIAVFYWAYVILSSSILKSILGGVLRSGDASGVKVLTGTFAAPGLAKSNVSYHLNSIYRHPVTAGTVYWDGRRMMMRHIPHDLFTELDAVVWREGEDAEWRNSQVRNFW